MASPRAWTSRVTTAAACLAGLIAGVLLAQGSGVWHINSNTRLHVTSLVATMGQGTRPSVGPASAPAACSAAAPPTLPNPLLAWSQGAGAPGGQQPPPAYALNDTVLWGYQYRLNPHALQRGLLSLGDPVRLRHALHRLASGQHTRIALVGARCAAIKELIACAGWPLSTALCT